MAVMCKNTVPWPFPVPYEETTDPIVTGAIEVMNKAVGFALFVPFTNLGWQKYRVKFHTAADLSCSSIGCQKHTLQIISLTGDANQFSCLHEMMHCLGFEHEQFHKQYPWDSTDAPQKNSLYATFLKATSKTQDLESVRAKPVGKGFLDLEMSSKKTVAIDPVLFPKLKASAVKPLSIPSEAEKKPLPFKFKNPLNQAIYEFLAEKNNSAYAESYCAQVEKKTGSGIESMTALCDFDSIMMYGQFAQAAEHAAQQKFDISIVRSGKDPNGANCLSVSDVKTLQKLYGSLGYQG